MLTILYRNDPKKQSPLVHIIFAFMPKNKESPFIATRFSLFHFFSYLWQPIQRSSGISPHICLSLLQISAKVAETGCQNDRFFEFWHDGVYFRFWHGSTQAVIMPSRDLSPAIQTDLCTAMKSVRLCKHKCLLSRDTLSFSLYTRRFYPLIQIGFVQQRSFFICT